MRPGGRPLGGPRGETIAYHTNGMGSFLRGLGWWKQVVLFLSVALILRNLMVHDYRSEAMEVLKVSGKSDEEIERYIPKTPAERRNYVDDQKNDYKKVKEDVAYLLTQVDAIKKHLGLHDDDNNNNKTGMENLDAALVNLSAEEKLKAQSIKR